MLSTQYTVNALHRGHITLLIHYITVYLLPLSLPSENMHAALQVADPEAIQLAEQGRENKPPLSLDLSGLPQPASDGRTPLSSLGGRPSQALDPLDAPGMDPRSDTALFYNGLFRSSLRHGLTGPSLTLP